MSDNRTIRRLDTPAEFQPGRVNDDTVYVVIDVMMFSSTVVALLEQGIESVIPVYTNEELQAYQDEGYLVGGEKSLDGTAFSNSPQTVFSNFGVMDDEDVPTSVALTSSNGARRVIESRDQIVENNANSEVVIGSTMNAQAIADWINTTYPDYDVLLYCAGSKGEVAIEDVLGAVLIGQYLRGEPIQTTETETLLSQLPLQRITSPEEYEWLPDEDVHHASQISNSDVVPVLNSDSVIEQVK